MVSAQIAVSLAGAVRLNREGRIEEVASACRQIIAAEAGNARACQLLGSALQRMGQAEEGVGWLRQSVELEPGSATFRCNLAAGLGMLGRHAEAELELRESIRLAPDSPQARNNLGVALEYLERYPEAVENLREAVRLSPSDARAWANLSNALRKNWQPAEALDAAERAAALDGKYAEAHNGMGAALLELNRLDEAAGAFVRAIELMPTHAEARVNGAMALMSRGDWVNGFRVFECRFEHPAWRRKMPGRRWAAPAVGSAQRVATPPPRTVLLYGEGGLGNAIQFARFATRVADRIRKWGEFLAGLVPGVAAELARGFFRAERDQARRLHECGYDRANGCAHDSSCHAGGFAGD